MKKFVRHFVITAIILGLLAGLLLYAGVYNVSARAGHLPPTAWLLHVAMRKSARTYSLGIDVPPLEDERMIIRGATYFSIGCAACHGEPGNPNTPVVNEMTPQAPYLTPLSWASPSPTASPQAAAAHKMAAPAVQRRNERGFGSSTDAIRSKTALTDPQVQVNK